MRVVLAGGGTAGHIEPALALADALRRLDPRIGITCLGTERGLETRLVPARGYELELVPAVPLPRSLSPQLLTVPGRLAGAIGSAAGILDKVGADVLVGFGGYVATPGYLGARRRGVPIVVHEANPGPAWPTGSAPASPSTSSPATRTPCSRTPNTSASRCAVRSARWTACRWATRRGRTSGWSPTG